MSETKTKKKHTGLIIAVVILAIVVLVAIGIYIVLSKTFLTSHPELKGEPEIGKWYRVTPETARSSDGTEWHGILRKGSENKLVVYFFGGGVSITEETSRGGKEFFAENMTGQDFVSTWGIGSSEASNPFKNWSFLVIPYASGDFHCGTGEYRYTEGSKEKIVYHRGYTNYSAFLEKTKQLIGEPDALLVTGFSAGGFATSLLADDVIDRFPSAKNITVCVDSSLLLYDGWHETAQDLWKAPAEITERLTSNNIVLDSLTALHNKRGDSVKILFDCSVRDDTLMQYQAYIREGKMSKTKENGDIFQKDLKDMVEGLQKNIKGVGIYIWEYGMDKTTKNTQHTILSSQVFEKLNGEKSVADWITDAIGGNVQTYGLELLDKQYERNDLWTHLTE